nr:hypothetical protein [Helicobacter equorum]
MWEKDIVFDYVFFKEFLPLHEIWHDFTDIRFYMVACLMKHEIGKDINYKYRETALGGLAKS